MSLTEKQSNLNSINPDSAQALTYAAYAAFVPIGIVTVLLGPLLPTLSTRWSLNYSQAGALFPMQYWASTIAVGLSGTLVSRFGFRFAMKAGLLLMGACVALLLSGSRMQGMFWISGYGAGLGLAIPAANLLVAEVNPGQRSSALNTLNFCWGIGAVACPFLVAAAAKNHRVPLFLISTAVLSLLVTIGITAMPSSIVEPVIQPSWGKKTKTAIGWKSSIFFTLAAMFFVYVGVENGFGGWVASYAKSLGSLTTAMAAMTPSFFYASLTLGRWIAPVLLRRISDVKLAEAGMLAACAGMAGLLLSHSLVAVALSALLAGLGLSSVYPIIISLLSREYGESASRVGSAMFTMANLGGGCLPWLVGALSTRTGALKAGLAVPLVGGLMLYLLFLRNWKEAATENLR
jgi:MFS transporter, FHS family, glucose/mannose:H+ symporter